MDTKDPSLAENSPVPTSSRKDEWDARARNNAAYWVLTGEEKWDMDEFFKKGDRDIRQYVIPYLDTIRLDASKRSGMIALDIGCGLGRLTVALKPLFGHVIGVDLSAEMIRQAQEVHPEIDFRRSEANKLPIKDKEVDYVFSFITFQHFPSKRYVLESFKEVYRVLKEGGTAQIQVRGIPSAGKRKPFVWVAFNRLWLGLVKIKGIPIPFGGIFGISGSIFGAAFKPEEIKSKLGAMGFKELKTWQENERHLWVHLKK